MNRVTVVFLALAILLAHTLAIHQTPAGEFGPPYDRAHVAFRIGRNLVHEGDASWDTIGKLGSWSEAYPSATWVALAAVAEELRIYPTQFAQALGILCALASIVVLAQFSSDRIAGLIAPVLFATTGASAAAGASGTEAPLTTLLVAAAFLSFERGWRRPFLCVVPLLCLTRPEGTFLFAAFALLELFDPPVAPPERPARKDLRRVLLGVVVALVTLTALRAVMIGAWVSPYTVRAVTPDADRARLGLTYIVGFFRCTPAALLFLLPLITFLGGRATRTSRHALILFLVWALVTVLEGGDNLPYWNTLAPALPLAFIAVQEEITRWLDRVPRHAPVALGVLGVTTVASLLTSKLPGPLGPLQLETVIETWMRPSEFAARRNPRQLGRSGLLAELREVERLRSVGVFLRENVPADARISTFWPGAIGYLSGARVRDLLGRTQPSPGREKTEAWHGAARVDLVRALEEPADYLVLTPGATSKNLPELLQYWLSRYDVVGNTQQRIRELTGVLQRFELVSVPVPVSSERPEDPNATPFLLLRDRSLGLQPEITLVRDLGEPGLVHVEARHRGHRQVVDLSLTVENADGGALLMRPTGEWSPGREVVARASLLLYDTGRRPIRLATASLPENFDGRTLTARIRSPGLPASSPFASAGRPATLELR